MKRFLILLLLLLSMAAPCAVAGERVSGILDDQRMRGYTSPAAAIARLQAASDRPLAHAPMEQRRRYHAAIAWLAVLAREQSLQLSSLAELDAMASGGRCGRCAAQKLVIQAYSAAHRRMPIEAKALIAQAEPLVAKDDDELRQSLHFARLRTHNAEGDFALAVREAMTALALAEKRDDRAEAIRIKAVLIGANTDLGDFARAEALSQEVYAMAERTGFTYMTGQVRLYQGHLYALMEEREKQVAALRDALRIAEKDPGLAETEATTLSNLSDYHLSQHEYREALEYALRGEKLAQEIDNAKSIAIAMVNGGLARVGLGDVDAGIAKMKRALEIAESTGSKSHIIGISNELIRIYEQTGRYREAVEAMRQIAALNQEMTRQEREKAVLELQEKYSAERRQREIERLSAENRLQDADLRARAWQQRLWAAVAVAFALSAVLLVQWLKRVRRTARRLEVDNEALTHQTSRDPLTGTFNRRHGQALMNQYDVQHPTSDAHASSPGMGLMLLDIDFFKRINDSWGHAAGDRVLVTVAERLRGLVRQQDAVVRWGGEEFVLVLPGTSAQGLATLAGRVLHAIGDEPVDIGGQCIPVTVSVGCVSHPLMPGLRWTDSLHVADLSLYQSKAGGRNRATCVFDVAPGADLDRMRTDLAAAQAAGDVELHHVPGPVAGEVPRRDAKQAAEPVMAPVEYGDV